eukprot:TRINITY_DN1074_c1_g2_i1.p1 TRINITY_DN1074_c1_g2~~TRINITY_DN1074_c1_g2_i1.p1  ORF type:complete len:119 (+),score=35.20 TRINITY_DN1074_c1_g2_i1:88-444(+)
MNTIRNIAIIGLKKTASRWIFPACVVVAKRFHMHQNNNSDDMSWIEANKKMSAEEKYAFLKQQELLKQQAEVINKVHREELAATRSAFESSAARSEKRIDELANEIKRLSELLEKKNK